MYLYQYFKEWRKNPQWSFSCCLALLLPLNDLQGEIRGMAGTNILKTQLDTGMMEKPSMAACAIDSGALSFSLSQGDGEHNDDNTVESFEGNVVVAKDGNTKCHRGTQTEIFKISFDSTLVRGSLEGNQQISL